MFKVLSIFIFISLFVLDTHADICGKTDDRAPSHDLKVGRLVRTGEQKGCGITLVGRKCAITVGECADTRDYAEFNVPISIDGVPQASDSRDVYYIKKGSAVFSRGGIGDQWAVLQLEKNRITNKYPGDVQGYYQVASRKFKNNEPIRVVSYGYAGPDLDVVKSGEVQASSHSSVMSYSQQVSFGKLVKAGILFLPSILEHNADTTFGSWGGPIISERTNEVIGINTHGGCKAKYMNPIGARFTNSGTSIFGHKKFREAIKACLNN